DAGIQSGFDGCIHSGPYSMALADPARSRSRNFWILPVDVFGNSPNTTLFGTLNRARWRRQCSINSAASTIEPGLSSTNAQGVSPQRASGFATTAAARIAG